MASTGILGLEMPLHQPQQQIQNPHNLHHQQQQQQMVANSFPHHESEDDLNLNGDDNTSEGKRKSGNTSPWQRMKWTDNMVRLLIMAVFYIGDEAGSEQMVNDLNKKKPGGVSQKKGKWKSVSRAMMEKGFYVSPQQCEDKFNDLNKRYKRVNDILGKGTACRVVENQALLETMDLTPKLKEEVKKLLNSKHLFFREMCAYHSSCGHNPTPAAAAACSSGNASMQSPEKASDDSHAQQHMVFQQQHQFQQHQNCSHSSENATTATNLRAELEAARMGKRARNDDYFEEDGTEDEDEGEDDDEEYEEEAGHEGDEDNEEKPPQKRSRKGGSLSSSAAAAVLQELSGEIVGVMQDGSKSPWEKKNWFKMRMVQLEEQQMRYQYQAFELEKQRLKWVRFSSKKEREMERVKLENERRILENERMVLFVRQKELELMDLQHQNQQQQLSSNRRSDPSTITG